jgi:hypothetical protein
MAEEREGQRRRQNVVQDVAALAVGMKTTLSEAMKPVVTTQYP